eukprot:4350123-Karenia_brevis.AAC.1
MDRCFPTVALDLNSPTRPTRARLAPLVDLTPSENNRAKRSKLLNLAPYSVPACMPACEELPQR